MLLIAKHYDEIWSFGPFPARDESFTEVIAALGDFGFAPIAWVTGRSQLLLPVPDEQHVTLKQIDAFLDHRLAALKQYKTAMQDCYTEGVQRGLSAIARYRGGN